ncbi:MAG TPA: sensor domain-containing diguanylate cyclase [Acidimicrobiales bacterium]|nr:sensor domain-containing diguanylate cyclase [Acidimicrobiales bacterium]
MASRAFARLRTLFEDVEDAVVLVRNGRVRLAGAAAERFFGHEGLPTVAELYDSAVASPDGRVTQECDFTTADGDRRRARITAVDRRRDRSVRGVVVTCRDITEEHRLRRRVACQAMHDPLTGLANRALFGNRLELAVHRYRRGGAPVSVVFLDLERFRPVNERLGHGAGDRVLREIAVRLRQASADGDTVARLGGDEFAVLVQEPGHGVACALAVAVAEPIVLHEAVVEVGVRVGSATIDGSETADDLLFRAALGVQAAKAGAGV